MLSDSYEDFLQSRLFLGGPAYGQNSTKLKPWYNYLYVAQFEGRFDKVKIGITSNIQRRNKELTRENEGANIRYAWSMPTNMEIEAKIKDVLSEFTKRFSTKKLKTETFYIPITPFILLVRLIILYQFLKGGYIKGGNTNAELFLEQYLDRSRLEYVKHNGIYYRQQDNSPRMKAILKMKQLIQDVLSVQRKMVKKNNRYFFTNVEYYYSVDDIIDQMRDATKTTTPYPKNNQEKGTFIMKWIESYTIDGQMKDTLKMFLPKEGQDANDFKVGDLVTVTYPPYREADKEKGGQAKQGDENYPLGGSWQGRIVQIMPNKYKIKWAFDEFKGTETNIPIQFVHRDGDVKRGIDITSVYNKLKLQYKIEYGEYDTVENIQEVTEQNYILHLKQLKM
mgnify:CR=1 FL=1